VLGPKLPSMAPGVVFQAPEAPLVSTCCRFRTTSPLEPSFKAWHGSAIRKRRPDRRTDDAINREASTFLEFLNRCLSLGPKHAINLELKIGSTPKRALKPANNISGSYAGDWVTRSIRRRGEPAL
jgi:hypothetical protein